MDLRIKGLKKVGEEDNLLMTIQDSYAYLLGKDAILIGSKEGKQSRAWKVAGVQFDCDLNTDYRVNAVNNPTVIVEEVDLSSVVKPEPGSPARSSKPIDPDGPDGPTGPWKPIGPDHELPEKPDFPNKPVGPIGGTKPPTIDNTLPGKPEPKK